LEQEIASGAGVFLRAGWNDGKTESWAFTEVERALALGATVNGDSWSRPRDLFGVAVALNGINRDHRDYLAAGGLGFMLGDGALNPSTEKVLDAFYRTSLTSFAAVTLEVQHFWNPGFNQDRGPVTVYGLRLHAEF
ncbi:MAG: carbohydrate porin, partial [Thermoanaerobaculia bacterium]